MVLAVFLPVLAGQSGNTGCQALAVTLRGLTLGELRRGSGRRLVLKEGLLGLRNGASEVRVVTRAGAPRPDVHAAIDRLEGAGATLLVDAAYAALLLTDPRRGRPLVVIFSDGADHGSWLTPEVALATAMVEDAVVHYVEIEGALTFLERLADATGGRGWSARRWDKLPEAFVEALDEFKSRYRLRYEPTGVRREGWHEIDVRLAGKSGKVRARPGYLVPGRQR